MSKRPKAAAIPHVPVSPCQPVPSCLHQCTFALSLLILSKLAEAELVSEREAVLDRTESLGGSRVLQASGGAADGEAEAFLDPEAFV